MTTLQTFAMDKTLPQSSEESERKHNTFGQDYSNLTKCGYYWGPMTRQQAEGKLHDQPDGTFLVRDSSSYNHFFSLAFRSWGKTFHTRIENRNGKYSICNQEGYPTIVELVDKAVTGSRSSIYCYSKSRSATDPVYPVRLTVPFSRLARVRSLKHLCRFIIRQHVNIDDIDKLKIPKSVKEYLHDGYF